MPERDLQDTTMEFSESSIGPVTTEWSRDSENTPLVAVISAVEKASGDELLELPPLYEAIDPEALNTLFTGRSEPSVDNVSFQYAGYDIVVRGSGEVEARSSLDASLGS